LLCGFRRWIELGQGVDFCGKWYQTIEYLLKLQALKFCFVFFAPFGGHINYQCRLGREGAFYDDSY